MQWRLKDDIIRAGGTALAYTVEPLPEVPVHWLSRRHCSIVERRTGLTTLQSLQFAAAGIVAQNHREIDVVVVGKHYTSFVTRSAESAVASAYREDSLRRIASRFPAFVAPRIAVLEYSCSC